MKKFDVRIRHLFFVLFCPIQNFNLKCLIIFQVFVKVNMQDTIRIHIRNVTYSVINGDMST